MEAFYGSKDLIELIKCKSLSANLPKLPKIFPVEKRILFVGSLPTALEYIKTVAKKSYHIIIRDSLILQHQFAEHLLKQVEI